MTPATAARRDRGTLARGATYGVIWALAIIAGEALAVAAAVLVEAQWVVLDAIGIDLDAYSRLGTPNPSWANFLYTLWMTLFHGGIFFVACVLLQRTERSQRLLGSAQIARRRTEALLEEAEFDALRGRVDPAFLLRAMAAVQARYASDAAAADQLLDRLVAFLRRAMPVVRSGSSSLKTELALASDYATLGAAIDAGDTVWRVQAAGRLPDIAFPPLLLMPLMDHFNGSRDTLPRITRQACLRIAGDAQRIEVIVEAVDSMEAAERAAVLPYRLQVALRAAFGSAWSVRPGADAMRGTVLLQLRIEYAQRRGSTPMSIEPAAAVAPG